MSLTLTTDHAASSYVQPVLLLSSQAYGPMDPTPEGPARVLVLRWAREQDRTDEERELAARFLALAWFASAEAATSIGYANVRGFQHLIRAGKIKPRSSGSTLLFNGADLLALEPVWRKG